jgi:hypothetical protein
LHRTFSFLVVILGLAILLAFLYIGLNTAEQGTQELIGLNQANQAMCFTAVEKGLIITFAGRDYTLPWKHFGKRLLDISACPGVML